MATEVSYSSQEPEQRFARYSLLEALLARRSRRFGKGMRMNGGPLAYASTYEPVPLTLVEEATLAFAARGITGYTMGELPYQEGDVPEGGDGRIPATNGPFRTLMAYQAHHLDADFYNKFYRPEAIGEVV